MSRGASGSVAWWYSWSAISWAERAALAAVSAVIELWSSTG
ncbi:MAG: hypothetical protein ACRDGT_09600 [Candidatus Limnocylindria bacterium]